MRFSVLAVTLCVVLVQSQSYAADDPDCDAGWQKFGNNCFFLSGNTNTWFGARGSCRDMKAFLAETKDKEINDFIGEKGKDKVWWIGANDLEVEGQFRWEYSLETIGFASWLSPDPNNHKNKEHCVLTNWGKTKKWVDAPCDWKKIMSVKSLLLVKMCLVKKGDC